MKIIAHRGFWNSSEEKNSLIAINRAFRNNFGIETDIRDYMGKLVISHNVADDNSILVEDVFKSYIDNSCETILALNVKADGIQCLLKPLLDKYQIKNYFLFDMSIPELVVNEKEHLKYFTRYSDIENECVMYDKSYGIWLDAFYDDKFMSVDKIMQFVKDNKKVCIVSPELHGKDYRKLWAEMKKNGIQNNELVILCTDKPDLAKEYFYGN